MYHAFLIVLAVGCAIMFADLVYATLQKPSKMQIHIVIMLVSIILMFAGYYFELKATTIDMALMGTAVSYIGKPFIMLHSLMVVCAFYDFKVPKWFYAMGSALGAVIFLLVITNPLTNLYYRSFSFDTTQLHPTLIIENGPLYWLHTGTMMAYFIAGIVISVRGYRKYKNSQNGKFTIYTVLMIIFVFLGYVAYLSGLTQGYDATIFGALAGVICLSLLFYRFRLFDAVSVAKDSALDGSVTGIIVVDNGGKVAYVNRSGEQFLAHDFTVDKLLLQAEDEKNYPVDDSIFSVSKKVIENNGHYVCTSFEINDVTVSVNYRIRLEKEVRERADRIESIQRKSIASLASVVEARSLETGLHIVNTRDYSRMIARELKEHEAYKDSFTDEYIELLSDVTPLHDIGKVSIPDNILLKPGRLDEAEFEVMKEHAETGAQIIERAMRGVEDDRYVDLAVKVALYHHERWDGKGYPKGLAGAEIPIEARIMAVADCFEALTSERCYKKAFSVEKSIAILQEESGTHFDPEVVEAFLTGLEKRDNRLQQ